MDMPWINPTGAGAGGQTPDTQVSFDEHPDVRAARRRIYLTIWRAFALLLLIAGTRMAIVGPEAWRRIVGAAFAVVGTWVVARVLRRRLGAVRSWYLYRHDRCQHCGYRIDPILGVKCPECGREPV